MNKLVSRVGRGLWTAYEYVAMVMGLGALALLCLGWLPFALLASLLPPRAGRCVGRLVITAGFRVYLLFLTIFCACRFDLAALDSLRRDKPLILVANHPSLLDVVMIVSRFPDAVCVIKASLMDNILLGAAARLARYIRNDAPVSMIRRAGAELKEGAHLVIFPEGSRTVDFPIDACTNAAGLIASNARVPLQSLIIEFSSPYLGKAWPLFRKPALPLRFSVRLGRRFEPPADIRNFTRELEDYFRQEMAGSAGGPASPDTPNRESAAS
jgi:1-acyl-sn-glycerol-3-phosphate acyltransferase